VPLEKLESFCASCIDRHFITFFLVFEDADTNALPFVKHMEERKLECMLEMRAGVGRRSRNNPGSMPPVEDDDGNATEAYYARLCKRLEFVRSIHDSPAYLAYIADGDGSIPTPDPCDPSISKRSWTIRSAEWKKKLKKFYVRWQAREHQSGPIQSASASSAAAQSGSSDPADNQHTYEQESTNPYSGGAVGGLLHELQRDEHLDRANQVERTAALRVDRGYLPGGARSPSRSSDSVASDCQTDESDEFIAYPHDTVFSHDDESVVHVDEILYNSLRDEVLRELDEITKLRKSIKKDRKRKCALVDCKFCLFTCFRRSKGGLSSYMQHLHSSHVPSPISLPIGESAFYQLLSKTKGGSKQLKLIKALFDVHTLRGRIRQDYFEHTTHLINDTLSADQLPNRHKQYGRLLRLVLTHDGPHYITCTPSQTDGLRRVGYFYYTERFATMFVQESMRNHGRLKTTRDSLIHRFCASGCDLWPLMPMHPYKWCQFLEDLVTSDRMVSEFNELIKLCWTHEEFIHISMDATVRVMRRIKGQADLLAGRSTRNAALLPDGRALRRVLTVRGRSGAVIGMWLVTDEKAETIARAFECNLPAWVREQIRSIATDDPSPKLLDELKAHGCTNLEMLCLDPIHLCITYKHAHARKSTPGSRFLKRILNRFNVIPSKELDLGKPFTGVEEIGLSVAELFMRDKIDSMDMNSKQAARIVLAFPDALPYGSRFEFIEALAALTSYFRTEVTRKTHVRGMYHGRIQGKPLFAVVGCAGNPGRMGYYWNNLRIRQSMPIAYARMLGSGTSSNEQLHAEVNNWFRNIPEMYSGTISLQLRMNTFTKLKVHCVSMYTPQLRQVRQTTVMSAISGSWRFDNPSGAWASFVASNVNLPAYHARVATRAALRARNAPHRIVGKRPASAVVGGKRKRPEVKRTSLSLKRVRL
jgi:hypothetical protein